MHLLAHRAEQFVYISRKTKQYKQETNPADETVYNTAVPVICCDMEVERQLPGDCTPYKEIFVAEGGNRRAGDGTSL